MEIQGLGCVHFMTKGGSVCLISNIDQFGWLLSSDSFIREIIETMVLIFSDFLCELADLSSVFIFIKSFHIKYYFSS